VQPGDNARSTKPRKVVSNMMVLASSLTKSILNNQQACLTEKIEMAFAAGMATEMSANTEKMFEVINPHAFAETCKQARIPECIWRGSYVAAAIDTIMLLEREPGFYKLNLPERDERNNGSLVQAR